MIQTDIVEMVHVPCDMCGGDAVTPYVTPVTYYPGLEIPCAIVTCNSCGFIYTCPRPTQRCMPGLYQTYYAAQDGGSPPSTRRWGKRLRLFFRPLWHRYCGQYLAEVIGKARGAVLEVGCGTGELLEDLARRGCRVLGVDINPTSVQVCRERGLPAMQGELDTLSFPPGSFDTVILWHALEHLPSPRGALEKIRHLLRPGGRLFIYCPNADSYLARFFGPYWYQWHLPFHFHHFTPASVRRLAQLGAFTVVRIRTVTPEFPVAYSLDLYGRTAGPAALRILVRTGFHRTVYFRLTVALLFRLLDWCMRGQGECLQVELMKPEP
jgi:SAM-dependent methyltransferase